MVQGRGIRGRGPSAIVRVYETLLQNVKDLTETAGQLGGAAGEYLLDDCSAKVPYFLRDDYYELFPLDKPCMLDFAALKYSPCLETWTSTCPQQCATSDSNQQHIVLAPLIQALLRNDTSPAGPIILKHFLYAVVCIS